MPSHLLTGIKKESSRIVMSSSSANENTSTNGDNVPVGSHQRHGSEEPLIPQSPQTSPPTKPPLKAWSLAIIIFYAVSGGPFGIEPTIRSGGNFAAILGFILFPIIFSVPEALVTAELGSAFHCASGGVAWVEEAFGEQMGFMCGWLSWIAGATDNAVYPILFIEYIESVLGYNDDESDFLSGWARFGCVAGITLILSLLNYRGLDVVGNTTIVICFIAMSPFIPMLILGVPKIVPSRWLQMPESDSSTEDLFDDAFETSQGPLSYTRIATMGGILWRPYINNIFWNLNSYDSAACFATETECVKTAYRRGIFVSVAMAFMSYIMPLLLVTGATDYTQSEWVDGQLGAAAIDVGGPWVGAWMLFAAGISNLGQFEAEMSSDSLMLMGMAERGYLPKVFKSRSKYGTPTAGIITGTIVIIAFSWADFGQLLELLNANYALSLILEYAAFVQLRRTRKDMQRPYRIPISDRYASLVIIPPVLGIMFVFLVSSWYTYLFCGVSVFAGLVVVRVAKKVQLFGSSNRNGDGNCSGELSSYTSLS